MSTHTNHKKYSKEGFEDLFKPRSEKVETKHDALILMAGFLSEIEYIQEQDGLTRKALARKIEVSPSYLTQVFRSKKPLNFKTLAKIKRKLNLRFEIKAFRRDAMPLVGNPKVHEYNPVQMESFAQNYLSQISDAQPLEGSIFRTSTDKQLISNPLGIVNETNLA